MSCFLLCIYTYSRVIIRLCDTYLGYDIHRGQNMNYTEVFIRSLGTNKKVSMTSKIKPKITQNIIDKWQKILDVTADILNVQAGLIMKISKTHMNVFVKSTNKENPYPSDGQDALGHGLYCETVIGTDQELEVPNALEDDIWKENPDVALNMIAYYGLPIKWHDGEVFGTICVLNDKTTKLNNKHKSILKLFKETIETDLHSLELIHTLNDLARVDPLTKIANRRHILEHVTTSFHNYKRTKMSFCIVMIDIDGFKSINDTHGHQEGDLVLKAFAKTIASRLRQTDSAGRLGGDEFLIVLNNTNHDGATRVIHDISKTMYANDSLKKHQVAFAHGIACISSKTSSVTSLIKEADKQMMAIKKESDNV